MPRRSENPADYIVPLNMNGLDGRMLRVPAPNKKRSREILLVYGHHAMLERWWSLVQNLNAYGSVTMPDLPGFGGMDSFYRIGKQPSLDNYADYLASFIKLRYKRRRITVVGLSFGFLVVTRMLQKYPELADRVDMLVSMVGFMHKDDFLFGNTKRHLFRIGTRIFATRPLAAFIRYCCLNSWVVRTLYTHLPTAKRRFLEVDPMILARTIEFDTKLWQINDVRTHWRTTFDFLNIDLCQHQVKLPIWHVASVGDHWLNNEYVKQHMLVVFSDYHFAPVKTKAHTPSMLADKKELRAFVPPELRRAMSGR